MNLVSIGLNNGGLGFGGDKDESDIFMMGQIQPSIGNRNALVNNNIGTQIPSRDCGFLTIKDYPNNRDINYQLRLPNMLKPNIKSYTAGGTNFPYGILHNSYDGTQIEWIITLQLYGYNK